MWSFEALQVKGLTPVFRIGCKGWACNFQVLVEAQVKRAEAQFTRAEGQVLVEAQMVRAEVLKLKSNLQLKITLKI